MTVAVLQPYFFPYIGYFQIIKAADVLIFYDDVAYIKGGWINRNRILVGKNPAYITVPLKKASPNKLIRDIEVNLNHITVKKMLRTISEAYAKAPNVAKILPIVQEVLNMDVAQISLIAANSVKQTCEYLGINAEFYRSSELNIPPELDRSERLIYLTKYFNGDSYINPIGGRELYNKNYFIEKGISLSFIRPKLTSYQQKNNVFHSGLSIIDVMMYNDVSKIIDMLNDFELE